MAKRGLAKMISYNKLWKILIDKQMKKKDLGDAAGVSANTLAKMGKMKWYLSKYWCVFVGR